MFEYKKEEIIKIYKRKKERILQVTYNLQELTENKDFSNNEKLILEAKYLQKEINQLKEMVSIMEKYLEDKEK